jgi:hypothetical protein
MRILTPALARLRAFFTLVLARLRPFLDKHRRTINRLLDVVIFVNLLGILIECVMWIGVSIR